MHLDILMRTYRGTEAERIGDVVDHSHSTVVVSQTVRALNAVSSGAALLAEGAAGGVVLIVAKLVVAVAIVVSAHLRVTGIDDAAVQRQGRGGGSEDGENDEELHG